MEEERNYKFSELVKSAKLTPAQVFLALFLSDCFQFLGGDRDDFYQDFSIVIDK